MIKEKHYDELKKLKEKISSIFEEIPDETEIIQSIIRMSNLETVSNQIETDFKKKPNEPLENVA